VYAEKWAAVGEKQAGIESDCLDPWLLGGRLW